MSDTEFAREVDEELRRDQLKKIWDRFGPLIIGAAVLIVAVTAGYRGWQAWQQSQAEASGDKYLAAITASNSGDHEGAAERLLAMTGDASGAYPVLARLRAAGEKQAEGDKAAAITAFETISGDTSVSKIFRDLATIRAGYIAVDTQERSEVEKRVSPINVADNPWRFSALEILGLAAWRADDLKTAETRFMEIYQDTAAPPLIKQRAGSMVALIRSHLKPETKTKAAAPKKDEPKKDATKKPETTQ